MNKLKFGKKLIIELIHAEKGNMVAVMQRLHCDYSTLYNYLKKFPEIQEALDQERCHVADYAESNIVRDIIEHKNIETSKWYLAKMRRDVYADKQEVKHTGEIIIDVIKPKEMMDEVHS